MLEHKGSLKQGNFIAKPTEEYQNMSPKNLALWHENDFELKAIEKKQIQEKFSALPLFS